MVQSLFHKRGRLSLIIYKLVFFSGTIDYSVRHSEKRVNCVKYTSMQADLVVGYDDGALQVS